MRPDIFGDLVRKCQEGNPQDKLRNPIDFPRMLDIELTNRCNLRCGFCPVGNASMVRPRGDITQQLLLKIMYEIIERKTPVRFIRFGEPTLHEYWDTCIKVFTENSIPVHMNTNGLRLDADKVLESKLDSVKISIHSQAGYNAARDLIAARRGDDKPFITVAYLSTEFNYGDLEGADQIIRSPAKDLTQERTQYVHCPEVYDKLSIDYDGVVTACCGDWDRMMRLGNLTEKGQTLQAIWRFSTSLKRFRNLLANNQHRSLALCRNCVRGSGGEL